VSVISASSPSDQKLKVAQLESVRPKQGSTTEVQSYMPLNVLPQLSLQKNGYNWVFFKLT
jgi:hypothetical protein